MIQKIIQRLKFYKRVQFFKYIYLNYCCKKIVRMDRSHIIPYCGSVIEMDSSAKIYISGGDVELGCDQLKGSKIETLVRLRENAVWSNEGGCRISYGSTIEILKDGLFDSKFFTMNSNSVIVAANKIHLGQDVMIGRGVVIYDSDHHTIRNRQGIITNPDEAVKIGDHAWLTTNVTVLKGSVIGSNSIVAANVIIRGEVPAYSICQMNKLRGNYGTWSREHPNI